MKKKTLFKLIPVALALCCAGGVIAGTFVKSSPTVSLAEEWSTVNYQSEYNYGDTLEIEKRTITIGGAQVDAFASIVFPDGSTYYKNSVVLNQSGNYIVKYTAIYEGQTFIDQSGFVVKYKTVQLGQNSSVSYGKHHLAKTKSGLLVRLAEGEKIDFNYIIDTEAMSVSDSLINVFATPDTAGVLDFGLLYIRMTDVQDENNYLDISVTQSFEGNDFPHSYVKAGGNGQIMEGLESAKNALHKGGAGGQAVFHNFGSCTYGYVPVSSDGWNLSFYYDSGKKQVYVNNLFVIDLDSTDYYTDLWKGFKSGKVRLSLWGEDYKGTNTANFCISQLYGQEINEELINSQVEDHDAPYIEVNTDYTKMPDAKINNRYLIPSASSVDAFSGASTVKTDVYYNYFSNNPISVEIDEANYIMPIYAGLYSIVYTSTDVLGNEAKAVKNFNVRTSIPALNVEVTGYVSEVLLGNSISIPEPTITGGSGKTSYITKVIHNGVTQDVKKSFTPTEQGEYVFEYTATDYIESVAKASFTVQALPNPTLMFIGEPKLPQVLISGFRYNLNQYQISDYTTGKLITRDSQIKITDANGEKTIAAGTDYIPKVNNNNDTVKIQYVYNEYKSTVYEIPTIIAYDESTGRPRLSMERYLCGEDLTYTKDLDGIVVYSALAGNSEWTFANSLLQKNLEITFGSEDGYTKFDKMNVYIMDEYDESNMIKFTIENENTYSNIVIGDETIVSTFGFNIAASLHSLKVKYNDKKIYIGTTYSKTVDYCVNGEPFKGFNSDKVWLKVEVEGGEANCCYRMVNIGGQPLSNTTRDLVAPIVTYIGNHGGVFEINKAITIPNVIRASDVLDPNVSFTMTLKKDGNVVKSVDGISLADVDPMKAYSFLPTEYGQYIATYTATDSATPKANVGEYSYAFNIEDTVAPEIKLTSSYKSSIKLGESFTIPTYTVTDNHSAASDIRSYVMITNVEGRQFIYTEKTYKPSMVGNYLVSIYAYDKEGNLAIKTIAFSVTK